MRFIARAKGMPVLPIELNLPGVHNVQNALAAIAVGREVGVADTLIAKALAEFSGVGRRFQRYGEWRGGRRVHADRRLRPSSRGNGRDDRGGARQLPGPAPGARVPAASLHAHARPVRGLRPRAFDRRRARADRGLPGGRIAIVAADGRALARAVRVAGKVEPLFVESIADAPAAIRSLARAGDVVITMGAGSIGQVASALTE